MAMHYPWLGVGPGAFDSAFGKYTVAGITKAAHEVYLQTAAEQGWAGLVILLWLLGAVVWTGWRVVRKGERAAPDRLLAVGAIGGVVVLLVHDLLDNDWYVSAIGLGFWLLVGPAGVPGAGAGGGGCGGAGSGNREVQAAEAGGGGKREAEA